MSDIRTLIWDKLNADFRNGRLLNSRFTNIQFLEDLAKDYGIEKVEKLMDNQELFTHALSEQMIIPTFIYDFIDLFIEPNHRIFDPWLNRSSYLVKRNRNGEGYSINQSEIDLIEFAVESSEFKCKSGDGFRITPELSDFQSIISFPPFGMRAPNRQESQSGDYATDLLIKYTNSIEKSSSVLMLCSARIAFDRRTKQSLRANKIGIKALFHLPEGSHLPMTPISTYLVIAEKEYKGETFVAELSDSPTTNKNIFNNYKSQKAGRTIQSGVFVNYDSFKSFESLAKGEELIRKGRTTGYPSIRLEEIIIENGISSIRNEEWALENHNSNCVYIPKVGNSPSVTHPSELKINFRNCFRVELNEDSTAPDYLVRFLRTPLGQLSLDSCKTGTAMQSLSSSTLKDALLFLPGYRDQIRALSIDNKVTAYINDFKEMKERLWSRPREQSIIEDQLKPFEDLNSVERWFDGIPFPLSSILWKYYATTNTKDKYEHLLHFFEALPEFLSMLFLSSFYQNKEFYKAESEAWLKNEPQYREWYKRTDFGSWNNLFANLAKATRSLLNPDKKEITLSLLGRPNSSFLNFITSKSVFNILDTVRQYRSDWKAHGGVSGEEENQTRLTILEEKLNELRKIVKDSFSTCRIVVPGTSSYENGLFKYKVKVLIGNRTPFNEIDVESTKPMDVTKLYMLHEGQNSPVELLPFIRYNQESKACYYYNKVESGNTRWVSFHYEETSEIQVPLDEKFEEVLNVLRQDN